MLTHDEEAWLRSALEPATDAAAWNEAAITFVARLRERGVQADAILRTVFVDWSRTIVPFGKHAGTAFRDADVSYLQWLRRWLGEDAERRHKFGDLYDAVVAYLGPVGTPPAPAPTRPPATRTFPPPPRSRAS
jgi:uncharacterized protein (DUF3820 family)